jgi:hypothetical protein
MPFSSPSSFVSRQYVCEYNAMLATAVPNMYTVITACYNWEKLGKVRGADFEEV